MVFRHIISYTVQGMVVLNRVIDSVTIVEAITTVFQEYETQQVVILSVMKVE